MATWRGKSQAEVRSIYLGICSGSLFGAKIDTDTHRLSLMKDDFLWDTATYFKVTVHPGYERPKRTGSQCSSISSSPHMRKARSSYR